MSTTEETAASHSSSAAYSRRNQVMTGELPEDFLRAEGTERGNQLAPSAQPVQPTPSAQPTQPAYCAEPSRQSIQRTGSVVQTLGPAKCQTTLSLTIVQAQLNKNYGLTKMAPFCRVRLGHCVQETHPAVKGAKNPFWNKTVQMNLPSGVDCISVEIINEGSFSQADRVAWGEVVVPLAVRNGDTVDQWFPLSGRLGEGKEGAVNLVMSLTTVPSRPQVNYISTFTTPIMPPLPTYQICPPFPQYPPQPQYPLHPPHPQYPAPVTALTPQPAAYSPYPRPSPQPQPQPQPQPPPTMTEDDLNQVKDMFPSMDEEVIRSVFHASHGNKDATVNSLLSMTSVQ